MQQTRIWFVVFYYQLKVYRQFVSTCVEVKVFFLFLRRVPRSSTRLCTVKNQIPDISKYYFEKSCSMFVPISTKICKLERKMSG